MHVKKKEVRYQNFFSEIQNSYQEVQFLDWHIGHLAVNKVHLRKCFKHDLPGKALFNSPLILIGLVQYFGPNPPPTHTII